MGLSTGLTLPPFDVFQEQLAQDSIRDQDRDGIDEDWHDLASLAVIQNVFVTLISSPEPRQKPSQLAYILRDVQANCQISGQPTTHLCRRTASVKKSSRGLVARGFRPKTYPWTIGGEWPQRPAAVQSAMSWSATAPFLLLKMRQADGAVLDRFLLNGGTVSNKIGRVYVKGGMDENKLWFSSLVLGIEVLSPSSLLSTSLRVGLLQLFEVLNSGLSNTVIASQIEDVQGSPYVELVPLVE